MYLYLCLHLHLLLFIMKFNLCVLSSEINFIIFIKFLKTRFLLYTNMLYIYAYKT